MTTDFDISKYASALIAIIGSIFLFVWRAFTLVSKIGGLEQSVSEFKAELKDQERKFAFRLDDIEKTSAFRLKSIEDKLDAILISNMKSNNK